MNTYLRTRRPALSLRIVALLGSILIVLVAVLPTASAKTPPAKMAALEHGFVASVNAQRANKGLAPLTVSHSMAKAADGWALKMTEGSFLAHSDTALAGVPAGWTKVGENVGRGENVASLTSAFMNSAGHRANILDPSYTHIGLAVYRHPSDGRIYTVHRFAALSDNNTAVPAPPFPSVATNQSAAPAATPMPSPASEAQPVAALVAPEQESERSHVARPHKPRNRQRTSLFR